MFGYTNVRTRCQLVTKLFSINKIPVIDIMKHSHIPLRKYSTNSPDNILSPSQSTDVLSELNSAPLQSLISYGLRSSSASSLVKCRPLNNLEQLLTLPGVGDKLSKKVCLQVAKCLQVNSLHVRPPITQFNSMARTVLSVNVAQGCLAYSHLSLPSAETSNSLVEYKVKLLDAGLLPVETSNGRRHPYKLYCKVKDVIKQLPEACCYVLPNVNYGIFGRLSAAEETIKQQQAMLMGMLQGSLATRSSQCSPSLYHVRESYMHGLFSFKEGCVPVDNIATLELLLRGDEFSQLVTNLPFNISPSCVPRIVTPYHTLQAFLHLDTETQSTIAPAIYCNLAFCTVLVHSKTSGRTISNDSSRSQFVD